MWDVIWYLGLPMYAVSVFGAPYKKYYKFDKDSPYDSDQYDVIYDQRQNGTENYKLSVDGLSLVWSSNSLLAAAALLEPALYGEYPDTSVDVILGPDTTKPEDPPAHKPHVEEKPHEQKPSEQKPDKLGDNKPSENAKPSGQTILLVDGTDTSGSETADTATGSKRKMRIPGLLKPFLRKRSSLSALPVKVVQKE